MTQRQKKIDETVTPCRSARDRVAAFVKVRKNRAGMDDAVASYNGIDLCLSDIETVLGASDVAQSTEQAKPVGWMSIETASKDGRVILVNDTNPDAAPWAAAKWLSMPEWSGWVYDDDLLNDSMPGGPMPTLWFDVPS